MEITQGTKDHNDEKICTGDHDDEKLQSGSRKIVMDKNKRTLNRVINNQKFKSCNK